jgi:hypothetical protein
VTGTVKKGDSVPANFTFLYNLVKKPQAAGLLSRQGKLQCELWERIDPKFYFFLDYKPDKPIPEVPTTLVSPLATRKFRFQFGWYCLIGRW